MGKNVNKFIIKLYIYFKKIQQKQINYFEINIFINILICFYNFLQL